MLDVMLSGYAHYALSAILAVGFPERVQAFYDGVLEPFFRMASPSLKILKSTLPKSITIAIVVSADVLIATGFCLYHATVTASIAFVLVAMGFKMNVLFSK